MMDNYRYSNVSKGCAHYFLWPALQSILKKESAKKSTRRVFEIGCGNGVTANMLNSLGYSITGIDSSKTGIEEANKAFQHLSLYQGSAYDKLSKEFGSFPINLLGSHLDY